MDKVWVVTAHYQGHGFEESHSVLGVFGSLELAKKSMVKTANSSSLNRHTKRVDECYKWLDENSLTYHVLGGDVTLLAKESRVIRD